MGSGANDAQRGHSALLPFDASSMSAEQVKSIGLCVSQELVGDYKRTKKKGLCARRKREERYKKEDIKNMMKPFMFLCSSPAI